MNKIILLLTVLFMSNIYAEVSVTGEDAITSKNCNLTVRMDEQRFVMFYANVDKSYLLDSLAEKGYQNIVFEYYFDTPNDSYDLQLSLVSNTGREPYNPGIYSCVIGGTIYKEFYPVSSVTVDKSYVFNGKAKCLQQIPVLLENLPECHTKRQEYINLKENYQATSFIIFLAHSGAMKLFLGYGSLLTTISSKKVGRLLQGTISPINLPVLGSFPV